ncbi:hypothetical protein V8C44DRAFT_326264 [Trichoderma aethiopicum]
MATSTQIRTPEEAAARIAYLASDVVISVQPSLAADSEFSSHLKRFSGRKDRGIVAATEDTVPEVSF